MRRSICTGLASFIFIVIGAGCITPPPPPAERGNFVQVKVGDSTVTVPWSNDQTQVPNQVTVHQIVDWTKQGVSSDKIISRIKDANPRYFLTADDIDYLNRQGVSQRVIETMQAYK